MKGSIAALADDEAARLRRAPVIRRLPGRNRTKADVVVRSFDGRAIAIKDYRPRSFAIRHLLGRHLIRRETRAYLAAGPVEGLAQFVTRVDAFALATVWFEGRPLREWMPGDLHPEFFTRLSRTVASLHARGVALCDLHQRDVVVDSREAFVVVDLAAAWIAGPTAGMLRRALYERVRRQDEIAVARLRARFLGLDETRALSDVDPVAVGRYRRARRLKGAYDALRRLRR